MDIILVFCILCALLFCGKLLRLAFPLLQKLYLPSSVAGGLLGLLLLSCFPGLFPEIAVRTMRCTPEFLINIVFATIFLGTTPPKIKEVFHTAFPQICMGQLLGWGQYVFGLGIVGFLLIPWKHLNPMFGNLLEIGFEGGHGTAGGMAQSFADYGWPEGRDLAFTIATIGMILGITLGTALINWAMKKGVVKSVRQFHERKPRERLGIYSPEEAPIAGKQTVLCDSIDSLAWHIAIIGITVFLGYLILLGLQTAELIFFPHATIRIFTGFPLFPLCMLSGILIQKIFQFCKCDFLIDHNLMQRISGTALDFLVVTAVATIQLTAVTANWLPILILVIAGTVWSLVNVLWIAPRLFKNDWFERAIAEFGQSTGVTATGLLLLRAVDPDNKTDALSSFGYKQLIHEPILGGGLWTALALTLVASIGWFKVWLFSLAMLIIWAIFSAVIMFRNRKN